MKTIYLFDEIWKPFYYDNLSNIKEEFIKRRIKIGDNVIIGSSAIIGEGAKIYKSILIVGSKHSVNYYGMDIVHIGCVRKAIREWLTQRELGEAKGYSESEIEEYKGYIEMIIELHKIWAI